MTSTSDACHRVNRREVLITRLASSAAGYRIKGDNASADMLSDAIAEIQRLTRVNDRGWNDAPPDSGPSYMFTIEGSLWSKVPSFQQEQVQALVKMAVLIVAPFRGAGPNVGDNPGTQLGGGEYPPGSSPIPPGTFRASDSAGPKVEHDPRFNLRGIEHPPGSPPIPTRADRASDGVPASLVQVQLHDGPIVSHLGWVIPPTAPIKNNLEETISEGRRDHISRLYGMGQR